MYCARSKWPGRAAGCSANRLSQQREIPQSHQSTLQTSTVVYNCKIFLLLLSNHIQIVTGECPFLFIFFRDKPERLVNSESQVNYFLASYNKDEKTIIVKKKKNAKFPRL